MSRKTRILAIDDDPNDLAIIVELCRGSGYVVQSAHDGEQGWQYLISDHRPDLIITDVEMPNLNGEELVARIHSDMKFQNIPIILLSSKSLKPLKELSGKAKVVPVIKPVNETMMREVIKSVLLDTESNQ